MLYPITLNNTWQNIYTLSGIAAASSISITNTSSGVLSIIRSSSTPSDTDIGSPCLPNEEASIPGLSGETIWAKCTSSGTILVGLLSNTPYNATRTELSSEELVYKLPVYNNNAIRSITTHRSEIQALKGHYYAGYTERTGVSNNTTDYIKLNSGSYPVVIEYIVPTLNLNSLTTGTLSYVLDAYVDISDINAWTYTGGTTTPAGRSVNAQYVNSLPSSTITSGGSVSPTGTPDYTLAFTDFQFDSTNKGNIKTSDDGSFFANNRQIVVPANSSILLRYRASGTAGGTFGVKTVVFFSELVPT